MKDGQGWLEWVLVRMPVTLIRLCRDTTQASARARLSGLRGIPSMWNTCSIRREGAARAHGILRVDIHDPKKAKEKAEVAPRGGRTFKLTAAPPPEKSERSWGGRTPPPDKLEHSWGGSDPPTRKG